MSKPGPITYTREIQISPWDAMLTEVRVSAGRVLWIDQRVQEEIERERKAQQAGDDERDSTRGGDTEETRDRWEARHASRELREWIKLSREERAHMASVARQAVSAGLSERYIESVQTEARMIAEVLSRALGAAELTPEQHAKARDALRVALADVGRELGSRHGLSLPPAIEG